MRKIHHFSISHALSCTGQMSWKSQKIMKAPILCSWNVLKCSPAITKTPEHHHTSLGEGSTQIISEEKRLWWTSCFSHRFSCEAPLQSCLTYSRGTRSLSWSILWFLQDLLLLLKSNMHSGLSKKYIKGHTENLDPGTLSSCLVNVHSSQPLELLQMGANLHSLLAKHLQIF